MWARLGSSQVGQQPACLATVFLLLQTVMDHWCSAPWFKSALIGRLFTAAKPGNYSVEIHGGLRQQAFGFRSSEDLLQKPPRRGSPNDWPSFGRSRSRSASTSEDFRQLLELCVASLRTLHCRFASHSLSLRGLQPRATLGVKFAAKGRALDVQFVVHGRNLWDWLFRCVGRKKRAHAFKQTGLGPWCGLSTTFSLAKDLTKGLLRKFDVHESFVFLGPLQFDVGVCCRVKGSWISTAFCKNLSCGLQQLCPWHAPLSCTRLLGASILILCAKLKIKCWERCWQELISNLPGYQDRKNKKLVTFSDFMLMSWMFGERRNPSDSAAIISIFVFSALPDEWASRIWTVVFACLCGCVITEIITLPCLKLRKLPSQKE